MNNRFVSDSLKEALFLMQEFEKEPEHPRHVANLAQQLFDSLKPWHKRSEEEGHLLHLAALLHDTGWAFSPTGEGHHKQSAKIILKHQWKSLSERQVAIVAQVARYHRKALPDEKKHELFAESSPEERRLIWELGGILRVADSLDRTHRQIVKEVHAGISSEDILLKVKAMGPWREEREQVFTKCDLLELATKRKIVVDEYSPSG